MTLMHRIEAAIAKALQVRINAKLTPEVIADRAANATYYVLEAIREEQEAHTPTGYEVHETAEEMADRLIK